MRGPRAAVPDRSPTSEPAAAGSMAGAASMAQQMAVGQTAEELAKLDQQACPVCGITFYEFRSQGRLGCPHDYVCFQTQLEPLILNIHGETEHVGKRPQHGVPRAARHADPADPPAPRNEGSRRRRGLRAGVATARRDPTYRRPSGAVMTP